MLQLATGEDAALTNPSHFGQLFEKYHGLIFRTAYRLTGSAADAEDVLQTIFLRLVRSGVADGLTSEESYFRRAAVNASLDLIRRRQTRPSLPLEDFPMREGEPNQRELRDSLRRAFTTLSPRAAEVFALRYVEDFSNGEIAGMLGISQVMVAVTLHRARRQLQKEIISYFGGQL